MCEKGMQWREAECEHRGSWDQVERESSLCPGEREDQINWHKEMACTRETSGKRDVLQVTAVSPNRPCSPPAAISTDLGLLVYWGCTVSSQTKLQQQLGRRRLKSSTPYQEKLRKYKSWVLLAVVLSTSCH